MTKAQKKAFAQFVAYVRNNYTPRTQDPFDRSEIEEEFLALVYRVDPECKYLYEHEFLGVLI